MENLELISFEQIFKKVSEYFKISRTKMLSSSRKRDISQARWVLMGVLSRKNWSLKQIGLRLNRDHTTVLHGLHQVEKSEILKLDVYNIETLIIEDTQEIDFNNLAKPEMIKKLITFVSNLSGVSEYKILHPKKKEKSTCRVCRILARLFAYLKLSEQDIIQAINFESVKEARRYIRSDITEETDYIKKIINTLNIDVSVHTNFREKKVYDYKQKKMITVLEEEKPCCLLTFDQE